MLICDKDYVFLGSRLGNSLLLRLSEKGIVREMIDQATVEPVNGEKNGNGGTEETPIEFDDDEEVVKVKKSRMALDQEEVEVYGSEKKTHFVITTFSFEVN